MKPTMTSMQSQADDQQVWIGGEATVSSQAGRHVRRQAGPTKHLLNIVLGLTFFGGLAMGGAVSLLWRAKSQ